MDKISKVLRTQFNIECTGIVETFGGLSASAYRINADDGSFFLKVYDKRLTQTPIWIENIDNYMPILLWLNENTELNGRIVRPVVTVSGSYRYDDDDSVYILFDFIEGETITEKPLTNNQIIELAEIMAHLHSVGQDVPLNMDKIVEGFDVPFCISLEEYINEGFNASPADVKEILQPCLEQLKLKINEVKLLSERAKQKNSRMVLCHTDAHGWNMMQSDRLVLVDWEGMKLAPAEADLFMFAEKDYWDVFLKHYKAIRTEFELDEEMLSFYVSRRKLEDIWAFLESILYDDLSDERRKTDLTHLSNQCRYL
jgi:spectinomycin phosphotransferase